MDKNPGIKRDKDPHAKYNRSPRQNQPDKFGHETQGNQCNPKGGQEIGSNGFARQTRRTLDNGLDPAASATGGREREKQKPPEKQGGDRVTTGTVKDR